MNGQGPWFRVKFYFKWTFSNNNNNNNNNHNNNNSNNNDNNNNYNNNNNILNLKIVKTCAEAWAMFPSHIIEEVIMYENDCYHTTKDTKTIMLKYH